jgi:hypothetical protein
MCSVQTRKYVVCNNVEQDNPERESDRDRQKKQTNEEVG